MSTNAKRFPIQQGWKAEGPTSVPWSLAEKAYATYARLFGQSQSLERLAERGGFGWGEFACLLAGHEPRDPRGECLKAAARAVKEEELGAMTVRELFEALKPAAPEPAKATERPRPLDLRKGSPDLAMAEVYGPGCCRYHELGGVRSRPCEPDPCCREGRHANPAECTDACRGVRWRSTVGHHADGILEAASYVWRAGATDLARELRELAGKIRRGEVAPKVPR